MSFNIIPTSNFIKEAKKLSKKYASLPKDLAALKNELAENPVQGISLGNNCYKLRMAIASKNKGKSAGARVITFLRIEKERVFLVSIYDKSERENISDNELKGLIKNI